MTRNEIDSFNKISPIVGKEVEALPCVFCGILHENALSSMIHRNETEQIASFMDLSGYPLVCPIPHIDIVESLTSEEEVIMGYAFKFATHLVPIVKEEFGVTGVNIIMNSGKTAGQEISHAHIHVLPRTANDGKVIFRRVPYQNRQRLDELALSLQNRLLRTSK